MQHIGTRVFWPVYSTKHSFYNLIGGKAVLFFNPVPPHLIWHCKPIAAL